MLRSHRHGKRKHDVGLKKIAAGQDPKLKTLPANERRKMEQLAKATIMEKAEHPQLNTMGAALVAGQHLKKGSSEARHFMAALRARRRSGKKR